MNSLSNDEKLTTLDKLNIYNNINNVINSLFNFENPDFEKYAINFNKLNEMKQDLMSKIFYVEGNDNLNEIKLDYGIKLTSYEYYYFIKNNSKIVAISLCYLINDEIGFFMILPISNKDYEEFVSNLEESCFYDFKEENDND